MAKEVSRNLPEGRKQNKVTRHVVDEMVGVLRAKHGYYGDREPWQAEARLA